MIANLAYTFPMTAAHFEDAALIQSMLDLLKKRIGPHPTWRPVTAEEVCASPGDLGDEFGLEMIVGDADKNIWFPTIGSGCSDSLEPSFDDPRTHVDVSFTIDRLTPGDKSIMDDLAALCDTKASWLVVRNDIAEGS